MSRAVALTILCVGFLAALGCNRGGTDAPPLSVAAPKSATSSRLTGIWNGVFVFKDDAPTDQFDKTVLAVCKSMRIRIELKDDGSMKMRATMLFPGSGEQTNEIHGTWALIREDGDTLVIRSTEDGGDPEEITLHFRGDSTFEMDAENTLKQLGLMRFTRESS